MLHHSIEPDYKVIVNRLEPKQESAHNRVDLWDRGSICILRSSLATLSGCVHVRQTIPKNRTHILGRLRHGIVVCRRFNRGVCCCSTRSIAKEHGNDTPEGLKSDACLQDTVEGCFEKLLKFPIMDTFSFSQALSLADIYRCRPIPRYFLRTFDTVWAIGLLGGNRLT